MNALDQPLLVDKFVYNTAAGKEMGHLGLLETTHYFNWSNGVASGVVEIESADDAGYTGTWAPVATITFSGTAPKQDVYRVQGAYKALRHRISTIVNGGTVTSRILGSR